MCKYCDYDIPLHYLINNAPRLTDDMTSVTLNSEWFDAKPEAIFPQKNISPKENDEDIDQAKIVNTSTAMPELAIDELTILETSATEDITSIFQVPDAAFGAELKGDRHYAATLASGEALPDWVEVNIETGDLTFQAEYQEVGNHQILVQVEDYFGQTANTIVEVAVTSQTGEDRLPIDDPGVYTPVTVSDSDFGSYLDEAQDVYTPVTVSDSDFGSYLDTIDVPQIAIADTQITDSSVGRELIFTVTLSDPSERTVTVDYATADDTAIEGEDYVAVAGTVTFEPGETEQTITVNTTGTSYLDPDENVLVKLSNPRRGEIADNLGVGTILPAYAGIRGGSRKQEIVTFSFFDEDVFGQGGYDGSNRESNAKEPSEVVKNNYRQIFADLNTFVEREFIEVEETAAAQGHIRIVVSDGPDYAYAGGHIHLAGWAAASDAGSNGWESPQGAYAYSALMHELGHAIGMPHSFGRETSVFDPEESAINTVMSYTYPGSKAATFMSYDIKSLQERYGAAEYRPEDTVYEFVTVDNYLVDGEIAIDTNRRLRQTIWDSGGTDTFDFSGLEAEDGGYRFDLNQSKYQTTQTGFTGASYNRNGTTYYVPSHGTSIAIDVEIENLVNSSSDDLIIANPAANSFSGYAPGLTTGDDVFIGTDELDTLDLSKFSFLDIAGIPSESDLKYELGASNSITVKDYFSVPKDKRMKVLLDDRRVGFKQVNSGVEGDDNSKLINFTVQLTEASSDRLEIDYTTADGTAKADLDYIPQAGTVVFESGETSQTIAVEVIDDQEIEGTESFKVNLLGNYGQIIEHEIGFIDDNDGSQSLSNITISDATVTNGNDGSKAVFTIRVDKFLGLEPVTVDFSTLDNVAIAGQDYEANNGTLVFTRQDRVKEQTIEVDIINNNLSRDEDFKLQLSNPSSNATIADAEGIGTIIDSTLKVGLADGTEANFQLASYPPDSEKDPENLPFAVSTDHNNLTITGDGNGWKEIPLADNLSSRNSPLNPYTVVEFDFKTTDAGKLHGLHFESKDHHDFYTPWEQGRFFQLYGSSEFGIQDFNNYQDLGQWKTYQIPVGQFIDNTVFHNGNSKAVQWLAFAHEGDNKDSNSQFRNLKFRELLPVSVAGVTVNESAGVATFTLTIPKASNTAITLDYATADATAASGQDFTAAKGQVKFAPGETSQTIEIAINDDAESEGEESFSLNLSNVNNAIALKSEITATINDNDEPLPIINLENVSFAEGNSGTNTVSITVSLDKPAAESIAVNYSTEDNTATAESDYQAVEGTVTFAPGETSKIIDLTLKGDILNEAAESFLLNFAEPTNATLANSQTEITIDNDDPLPNITVNDAGILSSIPVINNEGNLKNSTGLTFEVTLDAPSNQTVKVDYATVDGTAIAKSDYTARSKTLTFQPGETAKTVFVSVVLDETAEADEELSLVLSNAENAAISDNQAIGTIESTRSLFVEDIEISEAATEAIFTVSLDQPSVQGVFVNYATEDRTAKAGSDYTETKGRLFIKAGEASATVTVPLIDNNLTEADETFLLNLTKPKYVELGDARATATILNDDEILQVNPGGIYQNLQLWVKPDAAETTDEQKVTKLFDQSQLGLDMAQTIVGNRPLLNADKLNYNPVLSFDGDDLLETVDTLPADFANDSSVFIVTKSDSQRNNLLFTLDNTGWGRFLAQMPWSNRIYFDAGNTNTGRLSFPYADSQADQFNTWHFTSDSDQGQEIFRNGLSVAADENTGTPKTNNRKFQIGRQFQGDIAEVIVFNQALNKSDRSAVDSYLGIKYGFTIDQTTPTDYVNSDGSIIWDAATADGYRYDIAGIAQDNASGLNQIQSRSSNDDAVVSISDANNLDDGEALVWSNNNQSNLSDLIWQIQEQQGDVGTVRVSFDLSQLGQQGSLENYALEISNSDDFGDSRLATTGRTIAGNTLTFTGINFKNGEYFTLNTEYSEPFVAEKSFLVEELSVIEKSPVVTEPPITKSTVIEESPVVTELNLELSDLDLAEIHRFYNYEADYYLYSVDEQQSQTLIANQDDKFNYEGESFTVLNSNLNKLTGAAIDLAQPVYQFFNSNTDAHLFTMDINEKDYILDHLDHYQPQDIAYYAFSSEPDNLDTVPVYRLFNTSNGTHLLTSDRSELNYIQNNFDHFHLENNENPVFYALEIK